MSNPWIQGWKPLNGRPGLCMAIWSHVKDPWPRAEPTAYTRYARSACDTIAPLQLHYGLWRYIGVMPLAFANCLEEPLPHSTAIGMNSPRDENPAYLATLLDAANSVTFLLPVSTVTLPNMGGTRIFEVGGSEGARRRA